MEHNQDKVYEKSTSIVRCLQTELKTLELRTKMLAKEVDQKNKALEELTGDLDNTKEMI